MIDVEQFRNKPTNDFKAKGARRDGTPEGTVAYDYTGKKTNEDSPKCVAKAVTPKEGPTRYYLKACTSGPMTNTLFNPAGDPPESLTSFNKTTSRMKYEFRKVEKPHYETYVEFLITGNPAQLRMAERGLQ